MTRRIRKLNILFISNYTKYSKYYHQWQHCQSAGGWLCKLMFDYFLFVYSHKHSTEWHDDPDSHRPYRRCYYTVCRQHNAADPPRRGTHQQYPIQSEFAARHAMAERKRIDQVLYIIDFLIYICLSVPREFKPTFIGQGSDPEQDVRVQFPGGCGPAGRKRDWFEGHLWPGNLLQHHAAAYHFPCGVFLKAEVLLQESGCHSHVCHNRDDLVRVFDRRHDVWLRETDAGEYSE